MKLLIEIRTDRGLKAHIPDTHGAPLCQLRLKLTDWQIEDRITTTLMLCRACRRAQAKIDVSR
jgi:hypothetical protein